jgi:hypothetical protein
MPIDIQGFNRKIAKMRGLPREVARNLLQDGARFLQDKLVEEILRGESGTDYPKSYPPTVSVETEGYVGVVSGNLRRSVRVDDRGFIQFIFSDGAGGVGSYNIKVDNRTRARYGIGFFEIAVELYGEFITETFLEEITRFVKRVSEGRSYQYENPFPG